MKNLCEEKVIKNIYMYIQLCSFVKNLYEEKVIKNFYMYIQLCSFVKNLYEEKISYIDQIVKKLRKEKIKMFVCMQLPSSLTLRLHSISSKKTSTEEKV